MIQKITILLAFLSARCIFGQDLISPCPTMFSYLPGEATADTWNGVIALQNKAELSGIYLRVLFDHPPLEVSSEFGEVVQRESSDYLIKRPNFKLTPGQIEPVKITVKYNSAEKVPQLTGFKINANMVCPSNNPADVQPAIAQGAFVSLCPHVFVYDSAGSQRDFWNGVITLTSESELAGIYCRIIFDNPPIEVTADFGDVVQRESSEFLIRKPKHKLAVGTNLRIRISVRFDAASPAPRLIGVHLNAKTICPGDPPKPPPLAPGLDSPCPGIFTYQSLDKERGKWYGVLLVKTKVEIRDFTITVILDRPSYQLGLQEWPGHLSTFDNIEYQLKKPGFVLKPGVLPIRFFVRYKVSKYIPKLTAVTLNDVQICPEENDTGFSPELQGVIHSIFQPTAPPVNFVPQQTSGNPDDDFFSTDLDHFKKHGLTLGLNANEECGTVSVQATPFITFGQSTSAGQYPWHAALYHNRNVQLTYICGANLISKQFVLTVAHCASRQQTGTPLNPNTLVVVLGQYYLDRQKSFGIQEIKISEILLHPSYDKNIYKNDIALLRLSRPAIFTDTVRPVCLWSEPPDISNLISREGTVVGWGWDERGQLSEQLIKTNMPVVERLTCILSYPEFFSKFTNEMTYCAGFRNGSSACNGDSGGGMVFTTQVSGPGRTVWHLRGLVSVGVALQNLDRCDSSHYVVFTDVAKYLDWIRQSTR